MSLQKITFGDKEINKKDYYSSKQVISLDSVDTSKITVSNKWKINDTTSKCFIGYLNENVIKPLVIILPQMSGFMLKIMLQNISFIKEDKDIYSKYSEIWDKIKRISKLKFNTDPIRDEKYIVTKSKIFNEVNKTTFTNDKIPKERNHYVCLAAINIVSILKIDKKVYPQVYLEQCKYKLKNRKAVDFIDKEVELSSESDSDYETS